MATGGPEGYPLELELLELLELELALLELELELLELELALLELALLLLELELESPSPPSLLPQPTNKRPPSEPMHNCRLSDLKFFIVFLAFKESAGSALGLGLRMMADRFRVVRQGLVGGEAALNRLSRNDCKKRSRTAHS